MIQEAPAITVPLPDEMAHSTLTLNIDVFAASRSTPHLLFNVLVRNDVGAGAKANNATNYRNTAIANWGEDMKIFRCYPASCRTTSGGDASTNIGSRLHGNVGSMSPGTHGGLNNPYDVGELGTKSHNINLALNEHSYGATAEAERGSAVSRASSPM